MGVFGPFGPWVGDCVSVDVYIDIVYIVPTIGGMKIRPSTPTGN